MERNFESDSMNIHKVNGNNKAALDYSRANKRSGGFVLTAGVYTGN